MSSGLRTTLLMAVAAVVFVVLAAAAGASNSPSITFVSRSPSEGATLTTSSVAFKFTYNRKPNATKTLTCTLMGPTPSSGACDAPAASGSGDSQSGKSYSGPANGSYTFTAKLTLTDGGTASATRHFTVNVPPACSVVNTTTATRYTDLQAAINAASAGDELDITGTCVGNYLVATNLTLKGIDTAGVKATLDGNSSGPAVLVESDELSIVNLRIAGGLAQSGGGIDNFEGLENTVSISDSTIDHNTARNNGGGIATQVGTLTVTNSEISNNTALGVGEGGGIDKGRSEVSL